MEKPAALYNRAHNLIVARVSPQCHHLNFTCNSFRIFARTTILSFTMFRNFAVLSFSLLCALTSTPTNAALMATPEPAMDPLATSQLVVTSAGRERFRSRIPEKVLIDGSRICPKDYRRGFTIRCDSAEEVRRAKFYVNGIFLRSESHEPYYIAGNFKVFVKPWKRSSDTFKVVCRLGRRKEVSARITIGC